VTVLVYNTFEEIPPEAEDEDNEDTSRVQPMAMQQQNQNDNHNFNGNLVEIVLGLVCIVGLLLPLEGTEGTWIPTYLHLTVNQKLLVAYTLGLVTFALFK